MTLDFLTPDFFDALVIAVILIGGALAALRLYRDFTRPLSPPSSAPRADETTAPHDPAA